MTILRRLRESQLRKYIETGLTGRVTLFFNIQFALYLVWSPNLLTFAKKCSAINELGLQFVYNDHKFDRCIVPAAWYILLHFYIPPRSYSLSITHLL